MIVVEAPRLELRATAQLVAGGGNGARGDAYGATWSGIDLPFGDCGTAGGTPSDVASRLPATGGGLTAFGSPIDGHGSELAECGGGGGAGFIRIFTSDGALALENPAFVVPTDRASGAFSVGAIRPR